jgi:hypothetical protein
MALSPSPRSTSSEAQALTDSDANAKLHWDVEWLPVGGKVMFLPMMVTTHAHTLAGGQIRLILQREGWDCEGVGGGVVVVCGEI